MSLLLPVTTIILIGVCAFCLFVSIDNDRVIRQASQRKRQSILSTTPTLSFSKRTEP